MLEKLEVGKSYLNSSENKVKIIYISPTWVCAEHSDGFLQTMNINSVMETWSELPPEKEEWFQVAYLHKTDKRPLFSCLFHHSEYDFYLHTGSKKEDYHWIRLIKVEL
jgi:hypothetical protein